MKKSCLLIFLLCILAKPGLSMASQFEGKDFHRVVALGPLITDMIYLLEADQRLAGVTSYCIIPFGKERKEIIGTVMQMNVEKIVSLKPDAVFASTLTRAKQVEILKKQGIHVIKFDNPVNFDEICAMFLALGTCLGKRDLALEIIDETKAQVRGLEKKAQALEKRKVFIQIGIKPIRTSEPGTFISHYIELAGGINIATAKGSGIYNRENVLIENPDVILVATMGSSTKAAENEKNRWLGFGALKAARNQEIHVLDPEIVCSPTPVTFVNALKVFFECIHPEYGGHP